MPRLLLLLCMLHCCLALGACAPSGHAPRPSPSALMRADPGYVQWLERQAFLGTAAQYTGMVSGSELSWREPVAADPVDTLLRAAHTWLLVHPQTLLTGGGRSVFAELADAAPFLGGMGVRGLYVAPSRESGAVWEYSRQDSATGEDSTSPLWAALLGTEKDFQKLAAVAEREKLQLGADLVPAATGLGPDFFLAARNVRDYPGCYVMVEAPGEAAGLLSPSPPHGAGTPLGEGEVAALAEKHLLPRALARDALPWARPGGWAVTGEVRGTDGVPRRWLYRYWGTPDRPVLNWDDPSGAARRIFSASAIRQIGILRQTLGGLRLEALFGLDAAASLEPGPSALRALSREIRRYGGWSFHRDALPPELAAAALRTGVDFIGDTVTAPAAEYALLTGDVAPLTTLLRAALAENLDQRRLVRTLPAMDGLDVRPLDAAALDRLTAALQRQPAWGVGARQGVVSATAATLCALSAGVGPGEVSGAVGEILRRHLLLTTFRAALPGLLLLSGQDLAGVLNTPSLEENPALCPRGAWSFADAPQAAVTPQGVGRAPTAYAAPRTQGTREDSYVRAVGRLLELRERHGMARGTVTALCRTERPGSVAVLIRLPDGKQLLLLANFSADGGDARLALPPGLSVRAFRDLLGGGEHAVAAGSLRIPQQPWSCKLLLSLP